MAKKKPVPRVLYHIVCDDVRQEKGEKLTLVGCYGPSIFLNVAPPAVLPRLCFLFRITRIARATPYILDVWSVRQARKRKRRQLVAKFEGKLSVSVKPGFTYLIVALTPVLFPAVGEYKGKLSIEGARAYNFAFEVKLQEGVKPAKKS